MTTLTVTRFVLFTKHSDTAHWLLCTITLSQTLAEQQYASLKDRYVHIALCVVQLVDSSDLQKECDWMGLAKNGTCRKLPGRVLKED